MKKQKVVNLPKVKADTVAKNMKRALGEDRAFRVADGIAKQTDAIRVSDVNGDIFTAKELEKNKNFWLQVRSILNK
jgi:hypothetical protein